MTNWTNSTVFVEL